MGWGEGRIENAEERSPFQACHLHQVTGGVVSESLPAQGTHSG